MKRSRLTAILLAFTFIFTACGAAEDGTRGEEDSEKLTSAVDSPVPQGERTLQIATISPSFTLAKLAADFNSSTAAYRVEIHDYSNGGALEAKDALTRLNTDILSGNYPDMISFSRVNPYPYISKGLLVDLKTLLTQDEELSIDDIAIAKALETGGRIHFISGTFSFETLAGRYSDFGERFGWSLDEYIAIDSSTPDDIETIHNMTRESFIDSIVSRYIRAAIDWREGSCAFDTPEFIELLKAGSRIRETPEDSASMSFGYGPTKVGAGQHVASLSLVETVWKLAYEEQMAGCDLSFIGWPTVDGSCGSDAHLIKPVGIINQGEGAAGCWEFIKFMLMHPDMSADTLPVYKPLLQAKADEAKADKDIPVQLTDYDIERFFALVSELENVTIYDETVLGIIRRESAAFFSGDKTVEDAAKLIQSKVSIYLAEQN